jgi:hypothetical protein
MNPRNKENLIMPVQQGVSEPLESIMTSTSQGGLWNQQSGSDPFFTPFSQMIDGQELLKKGQTLGKDRQTTPALKLSGCSNNIRIRGGRNIRFSSKKDLKINPPLEKTISSISVT